MSKCRSMYAGSSGAVYNVNGMHPGNGNNKWQGLVSTTNMRSGIIPYVRTRADSDNRNVVFCMNQLGGVGRKSTMFATTADGVKLPCQGSGGYIPIFKLGLKPLQVGSWDNLSDLEKQNAVNNLLVTFSNNNQLWISNFDESPFSLLQSQIFNIYNTLVYNQTWLDYMANQSSVSNNMLFIPIAHTSVQLTTLQNIFNNINDLSGVGSWPDSRLVYLAYFGTKIRSQTSGMYDQNGFFNGQGSPVSGAPATLPPTSGYGVGLGLFNTNNTAKFQGLTYVLRPGSTN